MGVAVMAAATLLILRWARAGLGMLPLVAVLRAAAQLTLVALLLQGVLAAPWTVLLFLLLMLSAASWTSARRARGLPRGTAGAVFGVCAGSGSTLAVVMLLRLVELDAQQVIAIAGITIGGCMSVATLALRRFRSLLQDRAGEVEAWLSLGATPARAALDVRREAVRESLIPNLDQTKSTGIVTLPGAFVGALFAGLDPLDAARFQLVVLVSLGLAGSLTALISTGWAARSPQMPLREQRNDG